MKHTLLDNDTFYQFETDEIRTLTKHEKEEPIEGTVFSGPKTITYHAININGDITWLSSKQVRDKLYNRLIDLMTPIKTISPREFKETMERLDRGNVEAPVQRDFYGNRTQSKGM